LDGYIELGNNSQVSQMGDYQGDTAESNPTSQQDGKHQTDKDHNLVFDPPNASWKYSLMFQC
jgi:hypothetical protein